MFIQISENEKIYQNYKDAWAYVKAEALGSVGAFGLSAIVSIFIILIFIKMNPELMYIAGTGLSCLGGIFFLAGGGLAAFAIYSCNKNLRYGKENKEKIAAGRLDKMVRIRDQNALIKEERNKMLDRHRDQIVEKPKTED